MPINEAQGLRPRSTLTKHEQARAEAAIYGLQENTQLSPSQLSHEEIERLRAIVNAHDRSGAPRQFDLNNPPKEPYKHQDFPRVVYHHAREKAKHVQNQADLDRHLKAGWQLEPFVAEPEPSDLDAEDAAEAADVDAKLAEFRENEAKKKGK